MRSISYKGYHAIIEFEPDDELFVGKLAGINDVITFEGDTVAGLKQAFREAVDDYIAHCAKVGKQPERPYSGKMMFRVDPELHARAALAAKLAGKSLNQWAEKVLAEAAEKAA